MCNGSNTRMPGVECCILPLAHPAAYQCLLRLCMGCCCGCSLVILYDRLCYSRPHVHACPTGPNHTTAVMCVRRG